MGGWAVFFVCRCGWDFFLVCNKTRSHMKGICIHDMNIYYVHGRGLCKHPDKTTFKIFRVFNLLMECVSLEASLSPR